MNDLVSYLGESSCSTLSCSYKSLEQELCINVNDLVSYLGESSAPCTATTGLLKRSWESMWMTLSFILMVLVLLRWHIWAFVFNECCGTVVPTIPADTSFLKRWMTSYLILMSHHAVPCPAARSLWKRSYASMWMTSSLILVSHQHPVLQPQVSWRGVENLCEWPYLLSWWYWCCWGDISELSF